MKNAVHAEEEEAHQYLPHREGHRPTWHIHRMLLHVRVGTTLVSHRAHTMLDPMLHPIGTQLRSPWLIAYIFLQLSLLLGS
jgi:hypothetical protein